MLLEIKVFISKPADLEELKRNAQEEIKVGEYASMIAYDWFCPSLGKVRGKGRI